MYINKIINNSPKYTRIERILSNNSLFEILLDVNIETLSNIQLVTLTKIKAYKFINKVEDPTPIIFTYLIGIRKTPTNLLYHISHMNGKIILANTKNKIISKLETFKINSNSVTGLNQLILSLINEIKDNKINKNSPVVLHLHDFKDYEYNQIIKKLSIQHKLNIKTVVLTNTNPHNGCRPSKIKTKKYLNFQHAPKKIYKELFKEEMAERFKAIDCKSIR